VIFLLNDEVRRYDLAIRIYGLDYRNLLPIARLLRIRPTAAFQAWYDLYTRKYTYLEPYFIDVIDIPILDRVFVDNVTYKPEPRVYYIGIFVLGPLVIDSTSKTRRNLVIPVYEVVRLSGSDV
jgi:hypothetical protein